MTSDPSRRHLATDLTGVRHCPTLSRRLCATSICFPVNECLNGEGCQEELDDPGWLIFKSLKKSR